MRWWLGIALCIPCFAWAGPPPLGSVSLQTGAGFSTYGEGASGTLRFASVPAPNLAVGLEAGRSWFTGDERVTWVGAFARGLVGRSSLRPFLEVGVAPYFFAFRRQTLFGTFADVQSYLGASLGAGAVWGPAGPGWSMEVEARWHQRITRLAESETFNHASLHAGLVGRW